MKKIDDDDLVDVTGGIGSPSSPDSGGGSNPFGGQANSPGGSGGGSGDSTVGDDHGGLKIPD